MSEQSKPVGYVVRWDVRYTVLFAVREGTTTNVRADATVFASIKEAIEEAGDGFVSARLFVVGPDGTETPLPSYEEAVAEIERLRGDNEAQRFRAVEAEAAAFNANEEVERLKALFNAQTVDLGQANAEISHLKAHAATLPIALAPVPLGDRRPAVTGGECSACLVTPPYHEAKCERRGAAHDLTPSEVACAKVLDAIETYEETPGAYRSREYNTPESIRDAALDTIALDALFKTGLKRSGYITDEGRDLLARARKAGILGVSAAERAAWARYVDATIDDRDATFAEEQEQHGAEEWRERTKAALAAAKQALRNLGVDVDALLKSTEDI